MTAVEHTETKSNPYVHPVKEFLNECGINTESFPTLRLRFEIPDRRQLRAYRVFFPIYLPHSYGLLYESFFRVLRIVEIPDPSAKKHRLFMDVEWSIIEQAIPEEENHLAHHFLAREFICPNCKDAFTPNLDKINAQCMQIVCPQCVYEWFIRIDPMTEGLPATESLLELSKADPSLLREHLSEWDADLKTFENASFSTFFPVRFNPIESQSAEPMVRAFFGDEPMAVWKTREDFQQLDFASIVRSFANHAALTYFQKEEFTSKLTTTVNDDLDHQEKTEVQIFKQEILRAPVELPSSIERKEIHSETAKAVAQKKIREIARRAQIQAMDYEDRKLRDEPTWTDRLKSVAFGAIVFALTLGSMGLMIYLFVNPSIKESAPRPSNATVTEDSTSIPSPAVIPAPELPIVTPQPVIADKPVEAKEVETVKSPVKTIAKPEVKVEPKPDVAPQPETKAVESTLSKAALTKAHFRQGMLHLKLQQSKEAASSFQKVLNLDPKNIEAMRNLGLAYVYDQQFANAVQTFESYLKIAGNAYDRSVVEEMIRTLKQRIADRSK